MLMLFSIYLFVVDAIFHKAYKEWNFLFVRETYSKWQNSTTFVTNCYQEWIYVLGYLWIFTSHIECGSKTKWKIDNILNSVSVIAQNERKEKWNEYVRQVEMGERWKILFVWQVWIGWREKEESENCIEHHTYIYFNARQLSIISDNDAMCDWKIFNLLTGTLVLFRQQFAWGFQLRF